MIKQAYLNGFKRKCTEKGVNFNALIKKSGWYGAWPKLERASEYFLNPPEKIGPFDTENLKYVPLALNSAGAAAGIYSKLFGSAAPLAAVLHGLEMAGLTAYGFNASDTGKKLNKNTQDGWKIIMKKHPWIAGIHKQK